MTTSPTAAEISDAVGISRSYAAMILNESDDPNKSRTPPCSLAILIYRKTGYRHPSIAELTEAQMQVFEEVDPWTPRTDKAA